MLARIINAIKYWGQLFLLPIYWLSFVFPRSKKIWLFGSTFGRRFADNPRYLYLFMSRYSNDVSLCNDIRPIWISHDKRLVKMLNDNACEAYYYHSFKGIWYSLRAKVYFYDNYSKDISFFLSGGAKKINLWHGIPLKKIQADNLFDRVRHPANTWEAFKSFPRRISDEKPSHYVLTTSEFMKPIFESAFRTKNVLTSGYPRIDSICGDCIKNIYTDSEQDMLNILNKATGEGRRMIYYMPTFRDSETDFFEVMDLKSFDAFLEENRLLFCTKLHPKSKLKDAFSRVEYKNIINIDADADPYIFVGKALALVTDYSSIYFDWLFTDKPVIFFNYDYNKYLSDTRELYFDYNLFTPGVKAGNQEELQRALCDVNNGVDEYVKERRKLKNLIFDDTEGGACARLIEDVVKIFK